VSHTLGLVRDEADALESSICHAASFCDNVIDMDQGSSNDSWAIVEALAAELPSKVIACERTTGALLEIALGEQCLASEGVTG